MGDKPSNNFQSNRPESGGADRDEEREKSGLLEDEKKEFALSEKEEDEQVPRDRTKEPAKKRRRGG